VTRKLGGSMEHVEWC